MLTLTTPTKDKNKPKTQGGQAASGGCSAPPTRRRHKGDRPPALRAPAGARWDSPRAPPAHWNFRDTAWAGASGSGAGGHFRGRGERCSGLRSLQAERRWATGGLIGPCGAKLASHHPLQPVCGRAHVRAPGARACASPPFVRPPRRRALRSRQGPRARPPAVHPLRDAAHGPPVRSGAGGEVRRRAATPWKPRRPPRRVRPLLPARGPLPQSRGGVGPRGLGWEALRHLAGGWGRFV